MGKKEKIVLMDGHSILNRAFYGIPVLTNSQGVHTNAVYGFLNILFKFLEEEKADYAAVAFDLKAPTFRHKMYDAYKGTRKPMPQELHEQVPIMKEMLSAMNIPVLTLEGYEADDILGTVSRQMAEEGLSVAVISGDRDLLQLATDEICIRIPKTKATGTEVEDYFAADVKAKYNVTPTEFIDVKALMGDSSDNIPGVPSVGEKTATKLIAEFGSIEQVKEHLEEVKPPKARESIREHYDMAVLSKELATIDVHAPIQLSVEDARITTLYTPEAKDLCRRLELKQILSRFPAEDTQLADIKETCIPVSGAEAAEKIFADAVSSGQPAAFQVIAENGEVLGVSFAWEAGRGYYLQAADQEDGRTLCRMLSAFLEKGSPCVTMHLKEQLPYLSVSDQMKECVFDAAIAAYLLNPLKDAYGFEDIGRTYAGKNLPSRQELFAKQTLKQASSESADAFLNYVCMQTLVLVTALPQLQTELRSMGLDELFKEIEMPLVYTLYQMEKEGILVKADALKEYGEQLTGRIEELEKAIHEEAGEVFNIQSPKQLGVVLFEKLGLPHGKKTKSGYSTAADVLEKLAPDYPIVSNILEYRQLTKLKSTYADGLSAYIAADGRIHGKFHQTVTATGRISSADPNLQNIPVRMELGRMIRKVFVPKPGYVFVDADYSQIELRVLAHFSGDEQLIRAYADAKDIHTITASQVFHVPPEKVTPLLRRNAKAVNFGIVYGISSFGLSQDLSISRKEAQEYIENYFKTFPGIKKFLDTTVADAKKNGYVTTLYGRRRPMPELKSSNFMQRSFGERVAMNAPIQGTAADIIKIAMNRVAGALEKENLKSKLILQVHDELLIEAAEDEEEKVREILSREMKHAADLKVSLEIDMHSGKNWYEAH